MKSSSKFLSLLITPLLFEKQYTCLWSLEYVNAPATKEISSTPLKKNWNMIAVVTLQYLIPITWNMIAVVGLQYFNPYH